MPFADLSGARVRYEVTGDSPRTVLFSHGLLMDHEMFDDQVAALSDVFRCVTWDERGHGDTVADGPFTYWDSARDAIELLDHLKAPEAALVGMSQGGFLSLRAALAAPERVRGLVFLDSHAGPEDPDLRPAYDALFQMWVEGGVTDEVAAMVAATILGDADAGPWIAKWRARPPDQIRLIYATLVEREDLHDRLAEIACPALVIHGTADPAIPLTKAEALCAGLFDCRGLVPVEGGGHAVNLTHPEPVTSTLRGFLQDLWVDSPRGTTGK